MRIKIKHQIKKNREKLLRKQNNIYINYKELIRSYAEIENKSKMVEDNLKIKDSEVN